MSLTAGGERFVSIASQMVALAAELKRTVEGVEAVGFNDRVSGRYRPFSD